MKRIALGLWMVALLAGLLHAEDFTDALNQQRSARGLRAVEHDPGLDPIAKANNAHQAARGQGHWFTGGHAQCAYVGPFTALGALFGFNSGYLSGPGYIHSYAHAGLLFHPFAKRIGVDQSGNHNTVVIAFDDRPKNQVESKPAATAKSPPVALKTERDGAPLNGAGQPSALAAACSIQATPQTGCGVPNKPALRFRRGLFGRCRR